VKRRSFISKNVRATAIMLLPTVLNGNYQMKENTSFDVIIIGGSYAGLSAAMALGRSLRNVLIIDSGMPCNKQTPHAHNFITQDGVPPAVIAEQARNQVLQYKTIRFYAGTVTTASKVDHGFEIKTASGDGFSAKKLLFATGVKDLFPGINGFAACWGISVLHCPYCHGYEVRNKEIGVIGNGDIGFEFTKLLYNWSKQLTLFTNGKSTLTPEQSEKIKRYNIKIIEAEIDSFEHTNGNIERVVCKDNSKIQLNALFARPAFKQHCDIPPTLGCELTAQGYIKIDEYQKTSVAGVYAAGDNTTMFRAVSAAVAAGNIAGAVINHEMMHESF
jgi:thioredoxin reductase